MADGSRAFNFPMPQRSRLRPGEIVVDLFAGGGGASEGLKQALGIDPALAYNHDELAIGMHAANHPLTQHHREDIWHADPRVDVGGRPIGWFHASPDCTHFSQAKGGQPRSRKTRALSWVVLKWVGQLLRADRLHGTNTAPRIISMENVWQILTWGPLVAKRCSKTGRVITLDLVQAVHPESGKPLFRRGKPVMVNRVADKGERVPVERQALVPHKRYSGRTWRQFVAALRALGYAVEWRKLVASDYGAGTSRERLFLLGRRDGQPIVWPEPTHGTGPGQKPRVTAADCLDFSIPCPSIFTRDRPLADATMRRIAKGVMRHVINSADPFIVPAKHQGGDRVHSVRDPMRTITAANRGELMLAAPELAPFLTEHANASRQRTMAADDGSGRATSYRVRRGEGWALLGGIPDTCPDRLWRARGPGPSCAGSAAATGHDCRGRCKARCGRAASGEVPRRQHRHGGLRARADDHFWCWCSQAGRRSARSRCGRRLAGHAATEHGRRRCAHAAHHSSRSGGTPRGIQCFHGPGGTRRRSNWRRPTLGNWQQGCSLAGRHGHCQWQRWACRCGGGAGATFP